MAELATVARPYAEALFQSTRSAPQGVSGWLDALAAIAADAQLQEFATNPKVEDKQVFDVVTGALPQPLPPAGQNLLRVLIENGRLAALPEVARQYRALENAESGVSDAVVYSAFPLDAAQLRELGTVLERRFGRRLNLTVQEDPSLIGGVRVAVGDEVLDTSVKARLEQMKAALTG